VQFLTILLQQELVLVMTFSSFRTGPDVRPKTCGAGAGWVRSAGRVLVTRVGAGREFADAVREQTKISTHPGL